MARSLDQVLAEVTAKSDPQRQTVLNQIADLPNQQAAQTSAIGAQKDQAYQDLTDSARRRGLGFSGIPLGEQAKYAATTYAPALANLGTSFNNQKGTLESALSTIGQNDYSAANNIFNQDRTFEEQQRQFNASLAEQQSQAASARAATSQFSPSLLPQTTAPTQSQKPQVTQNPTQVKNLAGNKSQQDAYGAIQGLLGTKNGSIITSTLKAIQQSANQGNTYDQAKIRIINSMPEFRQYLANSNNATF